MEMYGGHLQSVRMVTGWTQERAAGQLPISERTLQGYEAKDRAPDDIVALMEELYGIPICRSPIEAGFHVMMCESIMDEAVQMVRDVFSDNRITDDEVDVARELAQALDRAAGTLFSASSFIKSLLAQKNAPFDAVTSTARRGA